MTRTELFPPIEPYASGSLKVDGTHTLYWEQSGNPRGVPALFLHGGPGSGATPSHRRFFDPAHYRIVVFDQRGAGRSTPWASITDNTTQDLVADIERLRLHLGVERWLVFGGSWGSTLALAYGVAHPAHCLGFVLRGIFLCRQREIEWFVHGMRTIFPEAWSAFARHISEAEQGDLLEAYYQRLINPDSRIHLPAGRAWSSYEGACSTLLPSPDTVAAFGDDRMALGLARIEAHYMRHALFLGEGELLLNIDRLRHLPGIIVQGRYDIVCPIWSADDLHRAWPEAQYIVVPDAGHSAMEPGTRAQLMAATERMKRLIAA